VARDRRAPSNGRCHSPPDRTCTTISVGANPGRRLGLDDESETDLPCAQLLRILVEALPIRDQEIFLKMETDDVLAKRYELTTQQVADIRYKRTRTLKRQVETSDEGMTTIGGANR
jgi:hypothetical protein